MSSIMDFLESMSNKEIHAKCLEYNLPNIPVTDSSRKVIIKRLHETMTGIPTMTTKKKIQKRQTMHETRTLENKLQNKEKIQTPKLQKRHTIAGTTEINGNDSVPRSQVLRHSGLEEAQTDNFDGLSYFDNSYAHNNASTSSLHNSSLDDSRSRRSVSLTKSGVLTTSYSTETVPLKKYADEIDEVESDVDEEQETPLSTSYPKASINYPTITHNKKNEFPFDYQHTATEFPTATAKNPYDEHPRYPYTRTEYPLTTTTSYDYEQPARYSFDATDPIKTVPKLRQTNVSTLNIDSSSNNNNNSTNSSNDYTRNSFNNAPSKNTSNSRNNTSNDYTRNSDLHPPINNNNNYKIPKNPLYPFDMLNSTAFSASTDDLNTKPYLRQSANRSSVYEEALKRTAFISPAAHQKPITRNSYNTAAAHRKVELFPEADELHYNDEDVAEQTIEPKRYASNFTRNLKHTSSPFQSETYKPLARRSIAKEEVSVMKPLSEFVIALDRKYHLMRYTFITALTLIVIFIVVLLLP